jgi:hypothetical protein
LNFSYQSLAANEEPPLFYLLAKEFGDPYRVRKRDLTGHGPPLIRAEKMQFTYEDSRKESNEK